MRAPACASSRSALPVSAGHPREAASPYPATEYGIQLRFSPHIPIHAADAAQFAKFGRLAFDFLLKGIVASRAAS